jgi:hypothetical protein
MDWPPDWTIKKMKGAAKKLDKGGDVYVICLKHPDLLLQIDEHIFKTQPDLVLNLDSTKVNDSQKYEPFSDDYLSAISSMQNVRRISMRLSHVQDLTAFQMPFLSHLSIGFFHLLKSSLDLAFIRNFPNLEDLRVGNGKYTGFESIPELSNLKTLLLQNITLDDVEFLSSAQIRFLMIDSCRINGSLKCPPCQDINPKKLSVFVISYHQQGHPAVAAVLWVCG